VHAGFAFTEGPAWDSNGTLYFTDIPNATIHTLSADDELGALTKDSKHANGLLVVADGRMLACQMDGQVVAYDLASKKSTVLADSYEGKRFNAPNDLILDREGGIYFTDPLFRAPEPLPQGMQAVYYIAPAGEVTRVTEAIAAPNGIGLSPDGKLLYVIPSRQAEMLVYDVDGPGELSNGRTFCRLRQPEGKDNTGGDGMAVDREGNLYITTNLGVEIFSPAGKSVGLVTFPQQPANVTFGGSKGTTMYVTARTGLYRVEMPIAGLKPN
jgi:gluconolactonase